MNGHRSRRSLSWAALTDRGQARQRNEDAWFAREELGLYGVADGLGGRAAGDLAARIVAETLPMLLERRLRPGDLRDGGAAEDLRGAISWLSDHLREESLSHPGLRGMGATVALCVVRRGALLVAHLGDSRVYLLREGVLRLFTRDHSLAQALTERGELSDAEAREHPSRGVLSRYLGMEGEAVAELHPVEELRPGDRLLLCTDGLSGALTDNLLHSALTRASSPAEACRELVSSSRIAGSRDDSTALVLMLAGGGDADDRTDDREADAGDGLNPTRRPSRRG